MEPVHQVPPRADRQEEPLHADDSGALAHVPHRVRRGFEPSPHGVPAQDDGAQGATEPEGQRGEVGADEAKLVRGNLNFEPCFHRLNRCTRSHVMFRI